MKLTVEEYAERKGISKAAVYKQINSGKLNGYVTTENGVKFIDEKALQGKAAQEKTAATDTDLMREQLADYKSQVAELKAELKAEREQSKKQSDKIMELLEKQLQLQENFQVLLARQQLPTPAPAEQPVEEVDTVETVENTVETVEQTVETPAPKKRKKWRLFGKRDNSTES